MSINHDTVLLAIRGTLTTSRLDEARAIHNQTAGNPQGVATARSLGDLSHNVYVPLSDAADVASELLILDLWNDTGGLQKFFSDPHVQAGGSMMFAARDPVVFAATDHEDFVLPVPRCKTQRFIGMIRGKVKSRGLAKEAFDGLLRKTKNAARMLGQISHQTFYRATQPGEPASDELLGIDVWHDAEGMMKHYAETSKMGLYDVFVGQPATALWKQPGGEWVEW